ncbi:general stress protein CsbD [Pandoraea terrae]|uniref:General stress protein CsbD n=1 Tax=Pandoraea terrae TaxID=1537710 RepID=A0A5E4RBL5_9BURK|nr:CsbD family protein [Pandoraea terrae]VVD59912.1 general stress protein CsbD [Pandoraea terrae]
MNSDTLKGKWNQLKGEVKRHWANLTDDDLLKIEGNRDKFVGRVQERYGKAKAEAEKEVDAWNRRHKLW